MLYIGADHRGFKLKEYLKGYLDNKKILYKDMGAFEYDKHDDYPDFALKVANEVAENKGEGVLICGSGAGVCMAANKIDGIRAVVCHNEDEARLSKKHDNSNILCLSANSLKEKEAENILRVWLETDFTNKGRHKRRLDKIKEVEKTN